MGATKKKLAATLVGADVDGDAVVVRYTPRRGSPNEIEDRIVLAPRGEMAAVNGVGRLLRILKAARVKAPSDPYEQCADPELAAALLRKCQGAIVELNLAKRFNRSLKIWTESGVERISGVIDYVETSDALDVRRRGGRSVLHIPKESIIRFEVSSEEYYVVTSIEASTRFPLQ